MEQTEATPGRGPLREIIDPFVHFAKSPRVLWGVQISYLLEGFCYFGILTLLAIYFNRGIGLNDAQAGWVVGAFTGGITLAMFFFGELADRWGVRASLALALVLMTAGRILLASSGALGGSGMGSPAFFAAAGGLLFVVLGYGMYQPAAYSAVRRFASKESATMGYAMLYGGMNLGAFLDGLVSPGVRGAHGIGGMFWLYVVLTALGVLLVSGFLTKKAVLDASERKRAEEPEKKAPAVRQPFNLRRWIAEHPLRDGKFTFFIFILIPVQTLFAHQWLTLPQYVDRAFPGFVSQNMEFFVNLNPLLIFVLTPLVAAFTSRVNVYTMMIIGTTVMALPTFFLVPGPSVTFLFAYIILMSVGEAMWQPRFLQLAAEIAPEGKTGQYIGIAQLPWFLTKLLTSTYSGTLLSLYCPETGVKDTGMLWLIHGCIAIASPVALLLARSWMGDRLQKRG